jgi:hypothetical protein
MKRTFMFDDGQAWHMELTRLNQQERGTASVRAQFWAERAPDQRVIGRLPPPAFALSDDELARALRQALQHLSQGAELEG